jgi:predicted amidohydrolase YtcJ
MLATMATLDHLPGVVRQGATRRLFTDATVWAGDECVPRAAWLLVENGVIGRIGRVGEPFPIADAHVEASGRHILPGFVDVHTHLTLAALMPAGGVATWRGVSDALAAVRQAAAADPDAPWLLFWNADPQSWPEARLPTADELDDAAPGRKVLLCGVDLHRGSISRSGLDGLGIGAQLGGRYADDVSRDRRGRVTGELWEAAFGSALQRAIGDCRAHMGDAGLSRLLRAEALRYLSVGITHAHDPYVPPSMHEQMADLRAVTALRLSWAAGPESGLLNWSLDPADAPDGPFGDAGREVKIFLDGADRCGLRLPLSALPGLVGGTVRDGWRRRTVGPVREGLRRKVALRGGHLETPYLRFDDKELVLLLSHYCDAGFRIRLHALGNLAAAQAARALAESGVPAGASTLDHLTVLGRTADLVAASGAYASYQPGFLPLFGPQFVNLGIDRHLVMFGGRLLTAAGAPVVISSDHPCGPLDPLGNLRAAAGRTPDSGKPRQSGQALTPSEAVRAASVSAMRSLDVTDRGALVPGAAATMTICTGDPFSPDTRVAETWIAGTRVWPSEAE